MPLLKDMIMREGIEEQELHISKMMYDNILRLGTTYTGGCAQTLEDIPIPQEEINSVEKIRIDIMKTNYVNVFASDKGGAKACFRPVTAHDWKEGATEARAYIKATSKSCPAAITMFVSQGCNDVGDRRRKGHTKVLTPSYIVQPDVNVRDLSSGGRLDDQTGQIATALGKTQFDLSSHKWRYTFTCGIEEEKLSVQEAYDTATGGFQGFRRYGTESEFKGESEVDGFGLLFSDGTEVTAW
jgi:hypothetical protein